MSGSDRPIVPVLFSAFLVLMGVTWLMAVPPGSAFDEPAHYVKAIGTGRAELYGKPPERTQAEDLRAFFGGAAPDARALRELSRAARRPAVRWQARTRRRFTVPPGLIDDRFGCTSWTPGLPATCLHESRPANTSSTAETYVGTYQPYVYVPAGLAIRAASSPEAGIRLGRAALFAVSLALLIAAVWLLWSPLAGAISLLGAVVALTPMVVFISTVLSPSGPEVAGAVCFCAALLRLARQEAHPPWLWVALGASGAVLSAARALGPGFVLLAVASIALLVGPGRLADRLRAGGVRAAAAGLAILVACGASLIWEFTYQPRPDPNREGLLDALEPSVSHLPAVAKQAVGIFGSLDAPMPAIAYVVWAALVVALTVAALASGSRRDRLSLVGLAAAGVGVTIVMSMVYREIGVLHGRYVLPFLVLIPLWTGEVVLRSRARLPARALSALVAGTFLLAGAVQMLGWWASARRFAVGEHGSWLFLGDAEWSPPLGWGPWFVIATLAAAAYVGAGAAGVRSRGFTRPADRV